MERAPRSVVTTRCATPDTRPWTVAPPRSATETSSAVTARTALGPVRNMAAVDSITTRSINPDEQEAPPAQAPKITLICGTRPDIRALCRMIWPYPSTAAIPS